MICAPQLFDWTFNMVRIEEESMSKLFANQVLSRERARKSRRICSRLQQLIAFPFNLMTSIHFTNCTCLEDNTSFDGKTIFSFYVCVWPPGLRKRFYIMHTSSRVSFIWTYWGLNICWLFTGCWLVTLWYCSLITRMLLHNGELILPFILRLEIIPYLTLRLLCWVYELFQLFVLFHLTC